MNINIFSSFLVLFAKNIIYWFNQPAECGINIRDGVMEMSNEEAHYWFGKISNGKRKVALKAMRVLLGEE